MVITYRQVNNAASHAFRVWPSAAITVATIPLQQFKGAAICLKLFHFSSQVLDGKCNHIYRNTFANVQPLNVVSVLVNRITSLLHFYSVCNILYS